LHNAKQLSEYDRDDYKLEAVMSKVLMDVFSVLVLQEDLRGIEGGRPVQDFIAQSNIIENAVLCDKILLESKQSRQWDVTTVTNRLQDVFEFVESGELNDSDESVESHTLRELSGYLGRESSVRDSFLFVHHIDRILKYEAVTRDNYLGSYIGSYSGSSDAFLERADYYFALARKLGVYLSLHPKRSEYLRSSLGKRRRGPSSKVAISHFDKRLSSIEVAEYAGVDLSVPPVVDYVMAFAAKNRVDILTATNEIRLTRNAVRFRERCGKIDEELTDFAGRPSVLSLQKLIHDIDEVASKWKNDLDEGVKYVRRQVSLRKVWGLGSLLESLGVDKLTLKDPVIFSRDGDLLFLNDLYRSPRSRRKTKG
jgi:hypothetical protein